MKEADIWEEFNKYKSTHKKEQALKKLFESKSLNSLERVCEQLLVNRSQSIKHVLLTIAEVLENRFRDNAKLSKLEHYQKYLKKERIKDFKNYWYKKLDFVKKDDAFKMLESKIQKRYDNSKSGKFSIGVEFEYSNNLLGHIMITCGRGMYESYELSHLGYGYHTNLRSYHNSEINIQPFNQIHLEKKNYTSESLALVNGAFVFSDTIIEIVNNFYAFHEKLYSEFSKLTVENYEDSDFLNTGFKNYFFSNDIRLILGIINVQISEKNYDRVSDFAKKGIEFDKYNHYAKYLNTLIK